MGGSLVHFMPVFLNKALLIPDAGLWIERMTCLKDYRSLLEQELERVFMYILGAL